MTLKSFKKKLLVLIRIDVPVMYLTSNIMQNDRSSHRRCSVRRGALRSFAKFTEKHLCQSLFFNKAAGLRPATKKETLVQVFSCEFCKFSKNTFFAEHLGATSSAISVSTSYATALMTTIYLRDVIFRLGIILV